MTLSASSIFSSHSVTFALKVSRFSIPLCAASDGHVGRPWWLLFLRNLPLLVAIATRHSHPLPGGWSLGRGVEKKSQDLRQLLQAS